MAHALASKAACSAKTVSVGKARRVSRPVAVVRAQAESHVENLSRRNVLGLVAGLISGVSAVAPSYAAYGDAANVFGKTTNKTGFVPYTGEGYALLLPSKWNPSAQKGEFPNVDLRYEDNFFVVNNVVVIKEKTDKKSIEDFGGPEAFLQNVNYLFGKQAYAGQTSSEGGFAPNRVSAASLLDVKSETDKKGNKYYKYDVLVRTADGDEGGRHQLIAATVGKDGFLYMCKVQIGDKRWIHGSKREAEGLFNSFTVA